jgi:two-component system, OmpR family, sensor kinase
MAAVLIAVGAFVYLQVRRDLLASVDMGLNSRAQVMVADALANAPLSTRRIRLIDSDEAFAQVLSPSGRVLATTPAVAGRPLVGQALIAGVHHPVEVERRPPGLDPARLLIVPVTLTGVRRIFVLGATLSNTNEALARLKHDLEIAIPAGLACCTLIGWLIAGAALRPVARMRSEAEQISAGEPRRLPVPGSDPALAGLARTLNDTFDRLQEAHARERRFVDDASHELRTPLAILKAEVESALAGPRDADELERTLESAAEEIDHLAQISDGLLVLAREHGGRIPVAAEPVVLRELLEPSVRAARARSAAGSVAVAADIDAAEVTVDRTRIRQVVDNLLENALVHTPPGGSIGLRAAVAEGGALTIVVEDSGPGFAPSVLQTAFEPFRRGEDPHRGAGLGLAIVRVIAEAHGGTVLAENLAPYGARVTITIAAPA